MQDATTKLFLTYETVRVMLETRGYSLKRVINEPGCEWMTYKTQEERKKKFDSWVVGKGMSTIKDAMQLKAFTKSKTPESSTLVAWLYEEKLGENIQNVVSWMGTECKKAVVIVSLNITPKAKQAVSILAKQGMYIDWFLIDDLTSVVIHHSIIPEHKICTSAEKKELLKFYDITIDKVQEIKKTDPVIKFMVGSSVKKGTLVKITRPSMAFEGGMELNYRRVS